MWLENEEYKDELFKDSFLRQLYINLSLYIIKTLILIESKY